MPGINVILPEEEFNWVPRPKKPWAEKALLEVIRKQMGKDPNQVFAFIIEGKFRSASGADKIKAAMSLGYLYNQVVDATLVTRHGTMEEAKAQGWWEEPMGDEAKSAPSQEESFDMP